MALEEHIGDIGHANNILHEYSIFNTIFCSSYQLEQVALVAQCCLTLVIGQELVCLTCMIWPLASIKEKFDMIWSLAFGKDERKFDHDLV